MDLDEFEKTAYDNKDKPGILLRYSQDEIYTLLYKDITATAEILRTRWQNLIAPYSIIGILIEHNIYIPSIIICILKLQCSFIFLKPDIDALKQTIEKLGVGYIVSYKSDFKNDYKYNSDSIKILSSCILNFETKYKKCEIVHHQIHIDVLKKLEDDCSKYPGINYVIKTSGTTGNAKYVKVYNHCIKANIDSLRSTFGISSTDLVYFGTSLTFDPSMVELYLALSSGACLLITSSDIKTDPKILLRTLFPTGESSRHVTFVQMVPSVLLRWNQKEINWIINETNLRVLALGGEPFPPRRIFERKNSKLNIFNLYGITEVSCWATCFNIDHNSDSDFVPLGEPLAETYIKIKNEMGEDSNEGEICIGSRTRYCDILQEGKSTDSRQLRGTGDIGYNLDGLLYYSGRKDINIVKRNGQRLNLLEIEKNIFELTNIHSICLWIANTDRCYTYLIAGLLLNNASDKSLDKIRIRLLTNLPPNSMPNHFFQVHPFPLTTNGKIDRKALEEKARLLIMSLFEKEIKNTNLVDIFRSIWVKYLCTEADVKIDEIKNFYEMGGDSIKRMEFTKEFRQSIGEQYARVLDEDSSFLFYCNYKTICKHLNEFPTKLKSLFKNTDTTVAKRRHENVFIWKISFKWKYDMAACVDSTASFQTLNDYTLCVTIGGFSHKLATLSAVDGREIFSITLPDAIENETSDFFDDSYFFVGCFDAKLYCISLKARSIKWSFACGDRIKNKPSIFGDKDDLSIIFGSYDTCLYCLKTKDGSLNWKNKLNGSIIASPCIGSYENKELFAMIITNKGTVIILDPRNGITYGTYETNAPVFGTPIYDDDCKANEKKICVFGDVKGVVHIYIIDNSNVNVIKTIKLESAIYSSPAIYRNFKDNTRTIIICSESGTIYFLEVDTSINNIELKNQLQLETRISTTPFYDKTNKILIVSANDGTIFVIDPVKLAIVGTFKLPGECFSSPVMADDCIYIGCRDNNLYCLEIKHMDNMD